MQEDLLVEDGKITQNEYVWHKKLYELETISSEYSQGKEYAKKIEEAMHMIETRRYRVAVIGEFKRGKSSMINALLGSEVLPTDILPMTAVVNRIVYGNQKEILIQYKDGRMERAGVEDLISYATKYDEEKAYRAEKVKEIVVSYPSVFCRNHVEIYDTPGLNDDEPMTETTLGILKDVNAAIVVISAVMPLSMTEQNLIIQLLECKEIHNIIFVITFIDAVSSRRSEQDKVINFMKNRIMESVLPRALSLHKEDKKFQEKARRILECPVTFAVSSLLAMKGFLQDDEELLEKSRFPEFKHSLLDVLTAGQSLEMEERVSDMVEQVSKAIQNWYVLEDKALKEEELFNETAYQKCMAYFNEKDKELEKIFIETDADLKRKGLDFSELEKKVSIAAEFRKIFIRALSRLRVGATAKEIEQTIHNAAQDGLIWIRREMNIWNQDTVNCLMQSSQKFMKIRQDALFRVIEDAWGRTISENYNEEHMTFPEFNWNDELYPVTLNLLQEDVMPFINKRIEESLDAYEMKCGVFIANWRKMLIQRNKNGDVYEAIQKDYEEKKNALQMQREIKRRQYSKHEELLTQLVSKENRK